MILLIFVRKLIEKCNLFETLVDQSHKVDKDILKFVLYQNIWGYCHSPKRREKENEG